MSSPFRSAPGRTFSKSRIGAGSNIGRTQGIHVLKPKLGGVVYEGPSWNAKHTTIRILPGLNDDGTFAPCRLPAEQDYHGPWYRIYDAVRRFGDPGVTFLLSDGSQDYNPYHQNPCWILYRAIKDAIDRKVARPEWYHLLQKAPGRGPVLSAPSEITLVQCILFRHNSQNTYGPGKPPFGFAPEHPTVVFELSRSSAGAFRSVLEQRDPNYEGSPDDPQAFVWPDITGIEAGAFVHFYELGHDPREQQAQEEEVDVYNQRPDSGGKATQNKKDIGYGCYFTNDIPGIKSAAMKGHEKKLAAKVKPWADVLHFMTDEEQAHLINKQFPASAIAYAFKEHPDWILSETMDAAKGVTRASVPNNPPVTQAVDYSSPESDPFGQPEEPVQDLTVPQESDSADSSTENTSPAPVESQTLDERQKQAQAALEAARARANARARNTPTPTAA